MEMTTAHATIATIGIDLGKKSTPLNLAARAFLANRGVWEPIYHPRPLRLLRPYRGRRGPLSRPPRRMAAPTARILLLTLRSRAFPGL